MKKFSLVKLTAVFVVVAMVLSVGMVALAANPGAYVPTDRSIQITDITCVASTTVTGLYNVTVKCEVSNDAMDKNAIGVTMLTYAKKDNSLNATELGYDAYDDTMQIVGIDQKQREDGVNAVEFTFAVTTVDADTNAYAVQPGKAAVILVSGDGLNPAAGLLTIPKEKIAATATAAEAEKTYDQFLYLYSYDTEESALEELKSDFSPLYAIIKDAEGNDIGAVLIKDEHLKSVDILDEMFTATAVIPSDAEVESDDYNVTIPAAGLTVTIDGFIMMIAWEADTVAAKFETAQNVIIDSIVGEEDIKGLFLGQTVEVSNSAVEAAKANVTVTDEMIVAAETNPAEFAVDGVFNYTITIPDTADYTVAESVNTIAVSVTIVEAPSDPFDIVTVEIAGEYGKLYTGEEGATKDEIVAEVILDLQSNTGLTATVKGANDNEIETWFINETTWAYDAANDVFTAEIVKPSDDMLGVNASNLKVEIDDIEITVVEPEGEPVFLGDVNLDGRVNLSDVNALKFHVNGKRTNDDIADEDSVSFAAADVTADGRVNLSDVNALKFHVNGKRTNGDIGTAQVGVKPAE